MEIILFSLSAGEQTADIGRKRNSETWQFAEVRVGIIYTVELILETR